MTTRACCVMVALLLAPRAGGNAVAQVARAPTGSQLSGSMTDLRTGQMIVRGYVCIEPASGPAPGQLPRCSSVDSVGHYSIDGIPAGTWQGRASCRADSPFAVPQLGTAQWRFGRQTEHVWDVIAMAADCDQRPLERITGRFSGSHYAAFETSWFAIDGRPDMFAEADFSTTRSDSNPIVYLPPDTTATMPRVDGGCYRMTVEGDLSGPNHYVHRPMAHYTLRVTRITSGQEVEMERCDQWVDRIVPQRNWLPPEPAADAIIEYLTARNRFTGERPTVVICATVVATIRSDELNRLSRAVSELVTSYEVADHCEKTSRVADNTSQLSIHEYTTTAAFGSVLPVVRAVVTRADGSAVVERFLKSPGAHNLGRLEYSEFKLP